MNPILIRSTDYTNQAEINAQAHAEFLESIRRRNKKSRF